MQPLPEIQNGERLDFALTTVHRLTLSGDLGPVRTPHTRRQRGECCIPQWLQNDLKWWRTGSPYIVPSQVNSPALPVQMARGHNH